MTKRSEAAKSILAGLLLMGLLAGCSAAHPGKKLMDQGDWIKGVLAYRTYAHEHPNDPEARIDLHRAEMRARDHYFEIGKEALDNRQWDEAMAQFQQGLLAVPNDAPLRLGLTQASNKKEAERAFDEAQHLEEAGKLNEAKQNYERALTADPLMAPAAAALSAVKAQIDTQSSDNIMLSSTAPITLRFRQTPLQAAYDFVAKAFGVNVVFDDAVGNTPITLFASDVTFGQAVSLMQTTTKTFSKRIGPNTLLIAPDTQEKRNQYEDLIVRTFQLNTAPAKDIANLLKGVFTPKKIIVNDELNTIILRDTQSMLNLADKLIQLNDRKPAEILLDVEFLEVSRTKAEQLGLDLGQQISVAYQPYAVGQSIEKAMNGGTVTLPASTFRFFKQDVDAKTLANPTLRVLNGKSAKIHIGDKIPLPSTTIQDATGQVRTTFTYTDVGIQLTADPVIHLDNGITIKLGIEISSLGQNLGTPTSPAFEVGTRNAETIMLLRDGETAIIGGLVRNDQSHTTGKVPGIGDIPGLGLLFTNINNSDSRTDILLTITPHVIRTWDLPPPEDRGFDSGTVNTYSDRALFSSLSRPARSGVTPVIRGPGDDRPAPEPVLAAAPATEIPAPAPSAPTGPTLAFSQPSYTSAAGQEIAVDLTGQNLDKPSDLSWDILFNPDVVELVRVEKSSGPVETVQAEEHATHDGVRMSVRLQGTPGEAPAPTGSSVALGRLVLRAKKPGVSFLVYQGQKATGATNPGSDLRTRPSRIVGK